MQPTKEILEPYLNGKPAAKWTIGFYADGKLVKRTKGYWTPLIDNLNCNDTSDDKENQVCGFWETEQSAIEAAKRFQEKCKIHYQKLTK